MFQYAPEYFKAERHQWLSKEKIENAQKKLLKRTLNLAKEKSPFYRDLPDSFASIPFTRKTDLQNAASQFLAQKKSSKGVWRSTSGSSGKMVEIFWDQRNLTMRYIFMFRSFAMFGHTPFKKLVYSLPDKEDTGRNFGLFRNQHISLRDSIEKNITRLQKMRPHLLSIYPSYAIDLGEKLGDRKLDFLEFISLNSETVLPHHRKRIADLFQCPVYEEYSTTEAGVIAATCKHQNMHIFTDNVLVEVIDEKGRLVPDGQSGELVTTTLQSFGMPFIRYRTGDIGTVTANHHCPCGRQLPILEELKGRQDDYLVSEFDENVSAWRIYEAIERPKEGLLVFKDIFLEQLEKGRANFYYRPDTDYTPDIKDIVNLQLKDLLGPNFKINFISSETIPRPDNIKRKYIHRGID